jgi:cell division protein FtsW (lipid II flippase)
VRDRALVGELVALAAAAAVAWVIGVVATDAWLARVDELALASRPEAEQVRSLARQASLLVTLAIAVLAAARIFGRARAREPMAVPWLVPAAVFACLLGLALQLATVETSGNAVLAPTGASFAQGCLLGAVLAGAILATPIDLVELARRSQLAVALAIAAIFVALAVAGTGPGGSGTRINLGPIQPIELVKLLAVVFLASFLGARAPELRWQRRRFLALRWPRLELLAPALVALLAIFGGLFVIGDLGPILLLAVVFLAMFFVASRATGWVVGACAVIAIVFVIVARWPGLVGTRVATRMAIWQDPWTNGLPHGHQVGEGLWSIAAGGPWGQGLGQAHVPLPPAAKTDLAIAPLVEQLGAIGLVAYLGLLAAIVLGGFAVAARARTPERVLLASGISVTLVTQWALIHAGTFGVLPLTGIVVPFVSTGRTSMVVFVALVGLLARLAQDGGARASEPALAELHAAARAQRLLALGLLVAGAVLVVRIAIAAREDTSTRGIAVTLRDGTIVFRQDPRLVALASRIRRGTIEDRHGAPLAITAAGGVRTYPLGDALGTLLGSDPSPVLRAPWALERVLDHRLRGYGEREGGPRYRDFSAAGPDAALPWPDLRSFAPLLALPRGERAAALLAIDDDLAARTVRLTLDARLQREVAARLGQRTRRGAAAAAVVIDVDTGEVLARVQTPDYDPGDPKWQARIAARDPQVLGIYGAWPDKTGLHGTYQAGSIAKLFVALAAARAGHAGTAERCAARSGARFECRQRDTQGPSFTLPGWSKPIHDHHLDPTHGDVDLVSALAVSCNVYFAQLGLALGPEPLAELARGGLDIGYAGRRFDPGAPGSRTLAETGFGQGAMAASAVQAARLVAAIAAGGRYRRCPPTMELGAPCAETALVDDPAAIAPIIAGMRRVMTAGTGRNLRAPAGLRVYGKTGTADAPGFRGEERFGFARGAAAPPHSWFVAFAEPDTAPECAARQQGRIAVAVVVPRGGSGASAAGPLAMEILAAARALGYLTR